MGQFCNHACNGWFFFYWQVFYNKILKRDSERVQDRFEQAKAQGVTVLEQRVPIEDIVQHINDAGTCIGALHLC